MLPWKVNEKDQPDLSEKVNNCQHVKLLAHVCLPADWFPAFNIQYYNHYKSFNLRLS